MEPPPKIAPPVRGIVMNYSPTANSREAFMEQVVAWCKSPKAEKSRMPGAIDRFGLMPPLPLADAELQALAGWMWDSIKGPLAATPGPREKASALGATASQQLMKTIRGQLETTLGEKGPVQAFDLCSEKAQKITELVNNLQTQGARIKRVSDRLRNPLNAPDEQDSQVLASYKEQESKEPRLVQLPDGNFRYYRPLFIEPVCLTCHGPQAGFPKGVRELLIKKYPKDAAAGYRLGELRGLVRVDIQGAAH